MPKIRSGGLHPARIKGAAVVLILSSRESSLSEKKRGNLVPSQYLIFPCVFLVAITPKSGHLQRTDVFFYQRKAKSALSTLDMLPLSLHFCIAALFARVRHSLFVRYDAQVSTTQNLHWLNSCSSPQCFSPPTQHSLAASSRTLVGLKTKVARSCSTQIW